MIIKKKKIDQESRPNRFDTAHIIKAGPDIGSIGVSGISYFFRTDRKNDTMQIAYHFACNNGGYSDKAIETPRTNYTQTR